MSEVPNLETLCQRYWNERQPISRILQHAGHLTTKQIQAVQKEIIDAFKAGGEAVASDLERFLRGDPNV